MTRAQWTAFTGFRDTFRNQCAAWAREAEALVGPEGVTLRDLQREAAREDGTPEYPLENPLVYNASLDVITEGDDISLIVVGDNPGKDEQLDKNRRYLVGQAGKLGEGFFRANPELRTDFRKNVVILNKTPIHTAKTKELAYIARRGGESFSRFLGDTQIWMARETARLRAGLGCPLWLVGYAELREKGLFRAYANELQTHCSNDAEDILLFQHFSMNRFSIDLKDRRKPDLSLERNLREIGIGHRKEILGW